MEIISQNRKYIGLGGCALAIIGCFLPFVNVLGLTANYIDGNGKLLLIAMVVSAVLIYLKKDKLSLISSGIGIIIFLSNATKIIGVSGIGIGIGLISIVIGLIAVIAYPFIPEKG